MGKGKEGRGEEERPFVNQLMLFMPRSARLDAPYALQKGPQGNGSLNRP